MFQTQSGGDMGKCRWWTRASMLLLLAFLSPSATGSDTWHKPGCHKVGEYIIDIYHVITTNHYGYCGYCLTITVMW